jgi:hypothetical protein
MRCSETVVSSGYDTRDTLCKSLTDNRTKEDQEWTDISSHEGLLLTGSQQLIPKMVEAGLGFKLGGESIKELVINGILEMRHEHRLQNSDTKRAVRSA